MIKGESFTDVYIQLARLIRDEHEYMPSPRDMRVKESLGVRFEITNARDRLLYIPAREMSIGYTIAEALWYFLGDNKIDWISYYSGFWNKISDDGETANSAYGARIFKAHQRVRLSHIEDQSQWNWVINELCSDAASRRAYIHIKSPLDSQAKFDVPCTIGLQFFIRDKKLHLLVNMRSSDLILGITYDVPAFTLMQEAMLLELRSRGLELDLGRYVHTSNSLHVYERHFTMLNEIADTQCVNKPGSMSAMPHFDASTFETLNQLQATFRTGEALAASTAVIIASLDDYYGDWARILYAHALRMQCIAAVRTDAHSLFDEKQTLLAVVKSQLNFEGYKRFDK